MATQRELFLRHIGQTSPAPLALEMEKAEGIYMFDKSGKSYFDLISGVSVSNLGHSRPEIIEAIHQQVKKYMHLMVYGELVQEPQLHFAVLLANQLPASLQSVYLVNSGAEAIEGALKLAKRFTGRSQIISCENAYHGSTHGAMSIMGAETFKNAFRPLLPDTHLIRFNEPEDLSLITEKTACIVVEPVQGESGIYPAQQSYLQALSARCKKTGTLLIFDEIQSGFGRTGALFAFQNYGVVPDILCLAKAMGGGMPLGGFISSETIMSSLTHDPVLGHITTFGGHPVSSAAALAHLKILVDDPSIIQTVESKAALFYQLLHSHPKIKEIRYSGLLMAVDLGSTALLHQFLNEALLQGILSDFFLFNDQSFRITPPLTISETEIKKVCNLILYILNSL